MVNIYLLSFFLYLFLVISFIESSQGASVGMCWGSVARQPIPPGVVVKQLQDNGVTEVKLFNANPKALAAMAGTGIEVMVMLTNAEVEEVALDQEAALTWVDTNVNTWLPAGVNIKYISVGNEPYLSTLQSVDEYLLQGFKNVYQALVDLSLDDKVKLTVSFNAEILNNTSPPSNAEFVEEWSSELTYMASLIYNTSSVFSVNIYPFYNFYNSSSDVLPASFVFFDRALPANDSTYTNVFDATFDSTLYALEAAGIPSNISVVVGEVGWPTDGDLVANNSLAQEFNNGAIKRMLGGGGTLKRPNTTIKGYMFGLFDEDAKKIVAGAFERKWGIYDNHGVAKYNLDLTGGGDTNKVLAATPGIYLESKKYCVLKSGADETNYTLAFNKICTGGNVSDYGDMADCTPVTVQYYTPGYSGCFEGEESQRVSYALNQYYQIGGQNSSDCDWGGLAQVTSVDPSYTECTFKLGLDIAKIEQYTASSSKFSVYVLLYIVSLIAILTSFL